MEINKIIFIALLIFISIAVCYLGLRKRFKRGKAGEKIEEDKKSVCNDSETPCMHTGCSNNESEYEIDPEELRPYIKSLATSIGPLFHISVRGDDNDIAGILFDNLDVIFSTFTSEKIKKEWISFNNDRSRWDKSLYIDKATDLLKIIKALGVEVPEENIVVLDSLSLKRYRCFGQIEEGEECCVLTPCVLYEGMVLEQGIIKRNDK